MVGMSDVNGCDKFREEAMSKYRSRGPFAGEGCQSLHKPKSPHALRSTVLDKLIYVLVFIISGGT